ncbi:MAG: GNAT family N-acetyltransferase [Microbacteriaceae bacterium]
MSISVRRMNDGDFFEWKPLFQQYATFYTRPVNDALALRTWGWLTDPGENLFSFVAERRHVVETINSKGEVTTIESSHLVGFVHFCVVTRALEADVQMQIQDHYVEPTVRRKGVAKALIEAVKMDGRNRGAGSVAWAVDANNRVARAMSEHLGRQTDWIIFESDM